jgi:hypothetical protein
MLGTDYPADMAQERPVEWVESCRSLTGQERVAILEGTARSLFGPRLPASSARV